MQTMRDDTVERDLNRVQLLRYAGPRQIFISTPPAARRQLRTIRRRRYPRLFARRYRR